MPPGTKVTGAKHENLLQMIIVVEFEHLVHKPGAKYEGHVQLIIQDLD